MTSYKTNGFEFEGIPVHWIEGGAGFPILMIHGSGPGASTQGNWRLVLEPLAAQYHIHAMDLIGFGQSGRRSELPYFDVDFWFRQCQAMIERMPDQRIGVIGHSIAGALALKLAAADSRIDRLLITGTMGAPFSVNEDTLRCWSFPPDRDALLALGRTLIHDHERYVTDAWIEGRIKALFEDKTYEPYFSQMFEGELQHYADQVVIDDAELARVTCPVTLIHGRDDKPFPSSVSIALAAKLTQADLYLLARCSHSVALEFPDKLLAVARTLFGS